MIDFVSVCVCVSVWSNWFHQNEWIWIAIMIILINRKHRFYSENNTNTHWYNIVSSCAFHQIGPFIVHNLKSWVTFRLRKSRENNVSSCYRILTRICVRLIFFKNLFHHCNDSNNCRYHVRMFSIPFLIILNNCCCCCCFCCFSN